ncbi:MAG: ABC transporter permease [Lactobacillus sp.]
MKKQKVLFVVPYVLWLFLFVLAPLFLIVYEAFTNQAGHFSFSNLLTVAGNGIFLKMMLNSFSYALVITLVTGLISYPLAYIVSRLKNQQLWLLLIILPTWINLLLKTYAFIGIFSSHGLIDNFLHLFGIGPVQFLFTDFSFIVVASYIEIPFMVLPIYDSIKGIDPALLEAAADLGASRKQTFTRVIWTLSLPGVKAGVQAVFIPSLSLFMITRLIGGNKVITLGTAIEEYFLTTMNWHLGSMIGVILILLMVLTLLLTNSKEN